MEEEIKIIPEEIVIATAMSVIEARSITKGSRIIAAILGLGKMPKLGQWMLQEAMSTLKDKKSPEKPVEHNEMSW